MAGTGEKNTKPNFGQSRDQSELRMGRQEDKGHLLEIGSPDSISLRLEELKNQKPKEPITEASLVIHGDEIKPMNSVCLCLTIIGGCLLCLPWFLFCCGWWKKLVWPGFQVPLDTYKKLEILLKMPSLKKLSLVVTDNTFDKQKADCLYQRLSQSSIQSFDFTNLASGTNWNDRQYSDFVQNMVKIKSIPSIKSQMIWHERIVK